MRYVIRIIISHLIYKKKPVIFKLVKCPITDFQTQNQDGKKVCGVQILSSFETTENHKDNR